MTDRAARPEPRTEPNRVRELRLRLGFKQYELAERAGVPVETLCRIEHGRPCRQTTKRKILRALGLSFAAHKPVVWPSGDAWNRR